MARNRSMRTPLLPGRGPLAKVPPIAAFLLVIGLFAAGVLIKGPLGAALLLTLAVAVAALLAATWGVLGPAQRAGRVLVVGVVVAIAISVL
ncbi:MULTISPECIES: DUF6703 family protein [Actinokineospora]|uniref:Uncharacterized protein n=1 Tax=Actinokineospora fastidiosa TaxID=1816 RepID=A0A918LFS3_9PSEU|nr:MULTISPECIES: DUF6703 family protein [Actinokineospora]UVS77739.1 hypothetical protein Actkin_01458 [Actinokineospora sp. UTMC 2448]GGS41343.1 hypothetical protein GCM10010171_39990 [Actinokineospora fastidiosa]